MKERGHFFEQKDGQHTEKYSQYGEKHWQKQTKKAKMGTKGTV